jgi:hypothetical protein
VWRRRKAESNLDDVVEYLRGIGAVLMTVSARLEAIERLLSSDCYGEKAMPETPRADYDDSYWFRPEAGGEARRQMQEIIDRVDARIRERRERMERGSWLRRLLSARRASTP